MEGKVWVSYSEEVGLHYGGVSLEQMTKILELYQNEYDNYYIGVSLSVNTDEYNDLTGLYSIHFSSGCGGLANYDKVSRFSKNAYDELEKLRKDISERFGID